MHGTFYLLHHEQVNDCKCSTLYHDQMSFYIVPFVTICSEQILYHSQHLYHEQIGFLTSAICINLTRCVLYILPFALTHEHKSEQ